MNLYTSSIRVCFLLFESMRVHLKFQLEVPAPLLLRFTTFPWRLAVKAPDHVCADLIDVSEEADGHHQVGEH